MDALIIEARESLRTVITKTDKQQIICDGVLNDGGYGENLSPLELMAAAVGSCILTTMGIIAKRNNFNICGTKMEVSKTNLPPPGAMIKSLLIKIFFKDQLADHLFKKLKRAAEACPAKNSLHPAIEIYIEYHFSNSQDIVLERL